MDKYLGKIISLQHHFNKHLHLFNLHKEHTLLLAVSGGIDSVVLTDLVAKTGFDFIIMHCNFQLRGEESERDEQFVRSLAEKYNKPILVKRFNTKDYATQQTISIQQAARDLRYEWFKSVETQCIAPLHVIVTAHHADDNIETLLMNFFRGTGIQGLHGILPVNDNIIRPLLFATREDIVQYANDNHLTWVEDSSNSSDKYTRNYFRHKIIPLVSEIFPSVEKNLLNNIDRFREIETLYKEAVQTRLNKLKEIKGGEVHIPILKLQQQPALHTIVWEIVKPYQFAAAQVEEVLKLLQAENSSHVDSAAYRIIKNRQWLIIAPLHTRESAHILVTEADKSITFDEKKLSLEIITIHDTATLEKLLLEHTTANNKTKVMLDADKIQFPLLLRRWKQGDYFYPFGMSKKKKLSRFFIDQKLSALDKEKIWLIESAKKIVWVVGLRIDNRFKVSATAKKVMQLYLS